MPKDKLYPEDRAIEQIQSIKWKAIQVMSEIDKALDYFEYHKKERKKKHA